jgi:hypothetical protein
MRDASPCRDLRLCGSDIFCQFCALDERLIRLNGEENRRAPTMLRQDQRAPRNLNLFDECRHISAELGKRANILAGTTFTHGTSGDLYKIMYNSCQTLSSFPPPLASPARIVALSKGNAAVRTK